MSIKIKDISYYPFPDAEEVLNNVNFEPEDRVECPIQAIQLQAALNLTRLYLAALNKKHKGNKNED